MQSNTVLKPPRLLNILSGSIVHHFSQQDTEKLGPFAHSLVHSFTFIDSCIQESASAFYIQTRRLGVRCDAHRKDGLCSSEFIN